MMLSWMVLRHMIPQKDCADVGMGQVIRAGLLDLMTNAPHRMVPMASVHPHYPEELLASPARDGSAVDAQGSSMNPQRNL